MRTDVFALAVLVLVGGSTVAACDLAVEQPIVVNASEGWSSVPTTRRNRPVMISAPVQHRAEPNATPPVYTPLPPPAYVPTFTYKPVLPIAPTPTQYHFGRGILGQPKVYVPGQPIRNFLRYLSL